ncbi:hypothetical protein BpHYR1_000776 [Brachionus plicatilis]|uniref:Uncharacterized protein n=1 Tax=Brachionus plicatilis TaxID=10195 RepID=A0A3M7QMI2_BRAPC|nr:hypothetical protein BpHYR1_000776 [Brachionus plicatilis]
MEHKMVKNERLYINLNLYQHLKLLNNDVVFIKLYPETGRLLIEVSKLRNFFILFDFSPKL